jgi:hypothetical protein
LNKEAEVADLKRGKGGNCGWNFTWHREIFAWEVEMLQQVLSELESVTSREGHMDVTVWLEDSSNYYSVQSAYRVLPEESNKTVQSFDTKVWHKLVPLKVVVLLAVLYKIGFLQRLNCLK